MLCCVEWLLVGCMVCKSDYGSPSIGVEGGAVGAPVLIGTIAPNASVECTTSYEYDICLPCEEVRRRRKHSITTAATIAAAAKPPTAMEMMSGKCDGEFFVVAALVGCAGVSVTVMLNDVV